MDTQIRLWHQQIMSKRNASDKANTPDEIVDVVNENDEVIGQATKDEVNSNTHLIHREVAIIIYDDTGKVLIQQRSRHKKVKPLMWTRSAAGHIPTGRDPITTAHKELQEELGFDTALKFTYKKLIRHENETHFRYQFIGFIPSSVIINVNRDEIEKVKFVSKPELEKMISNGDTVSQTSLKDIINLLEDIPNPSQ